MRHLSRVSMPGARLETRSIARDKSSGQLIRARGVAAAVAVVDVKRSSPSGAGSPRRNAITA